jgi:hypothetical protein
MQTHSVLRERGLRRTETTSAGPAAGIALGGAIQNESPAELARDFDAVGFERRALDSHGRQLGHRAAWRAELLQLGPVRPDGRRREHARPPRSGHDPLHAAVGTPRRACGQHSSGLARAYATFAGAAAARYSARGVHAYEIWNEPNNASFWAPRADGARYAGLLKAASASIRRADANATIVTGGMSPATDAGGNVAPVTFLKQLYANAPESRSTRSAIIRTAGLRCQGIPRHGARGTR